MTRVRWMGSLATALVCTATLAAQDAYRRPSSTTPRPLPPRPGTAVAPSPVRPATPPPTEGPTRTPTATASAVRQASHEAAAPPPILAAPSQPAAKPAELAPAPPVAKQPAMIKLSVPADAQVWVESQKMTQTGPHRIFQSPPLDVGKPFYYKLKVVWTVGGSHREHSIEQEVTVKAGETTTLDFTPVTSTVKAPPPLSSVRQAALDVPVPPRKGAVRQAKAETSGKDD